MAKVLVVDDYEDIVDNLEDLLSEAGNEVTKAYSKEEAIELIKREHFDVIVVDLVMQRDKSGLVMETDKSGIEVLKKAKEIDPFVEVIVLTAYGAVKTAVPAMKLGAFDYVEKSTEIDDEGDVYDKMVNTVHKAVEHRMAHKSEIKETVGKFILDELTKSGVLSLPQLLAKSPFPPDAVHKGLKVLQEAEKIETRVDPKTEVEMYKRRYSGLGDKILSQISMRS